MVLPSCPVHTREQDAAAYLVLMRRTEQVVGTAEAEKGSSTMAKRSAPGPIPLSTGRLACFSVRLFTVPVAEGEATLMEIDLPAIWNFRLQRQRSSSNACSTEYMCCR